MDEGQLAIATKRPPVALRIRQFAASARVQSDAGHAACTRRSVSVWTLAGTPGASQLLQGGRRPSPRTPSATCP